MIRPEYDAVAAVEAKLFSWHGRGCRIGTFERHTTILVRSQPTPLKNEPTQSQVFTVPYNEHSADKIII